MLTNDDRQNKMNTPDVDLMVKETLERWKSEGGIKPDEKRPITYGVELEIW